MPRGVYVRTKEHKRNISEALKGKICPEEIRRKISETTRVTMNRPEVREKISKASKKNWQNPEYRKKNKTSTGKRWVGWSKDLTKETDNRVAKQSEKIKIAMNRPKMKKYMSEISIKKFQDPKERVKVSRGTKKAMNRPEVKAKLRKPKSKEHKAKLKEIFNHPEVKEKRSVAWEKRAESSGYPKNYLCPNFNFKSICIFEALDKVLHTRSRFGGIKAGEKKIGRYFVDYFNSRYRLIIEWNEFYHYDFDGDLNTYDIAKRKYILERFPDFKYFIIKQSEWLNPEKLTKEIIDKIVSHILFKLSIGR